MHFRAFKSAVSLKLEVFVAVGTVAAVFPRLQKRGLIEAWRSVPAAETGGGFPRLQKRGLIEAQKQARERVPGKKFPRLQKRGLIEAPRCDRWQTLKWDFRAFKSAVSLKQDERPDRGL